MTDFTSLPERTKSNLTRLATAVNSVVADKTKSWEIHTDSLDEDGDKPALVNEIKEWAGNTGLYIYTVGYESKRLT